MKILNKFIWSKTEPKNTNDVWFDGSVFRLFKEEEWQAFTLPVDAAEKVAEVIKNASETYQEKLEAGHGIVIEDNVISAVTPNYHAEENEDGYIKNRTHYIKGVTITSEGFYDSENGRILYRDRDITLPEDGSTVQLENGPYVYACFIKGTNKIQITSPSNSWLKLHPIKVIDEVVPLSEMYIPETIARKQELTELSAQIGEHYSATAATHLSYGYNNRIDQNLSQGTTINISLDNQSTFLKDKTIAFVSDGFSSTIYKQFPFDAFDVELANDMTYVRCSVNPDGVKSVDDVTFTVDVFGLLGDKINALEQKDKDLFKSIARPIITVIDDDTLGYDSVKLFHDVCVQNGIKGTYATLTSIALSDERLIPLMQQYEQEGFHFALHGKTQSPSYSPEFNAAEAEKDFVEGMRQMQSANFLDWKFFIIPYGAYQPELQQMAKKWGCKCAVGIGQNTYINKSEKANRFYLPRAGFNAQETGSVTFEQLKALIDEAASNNGWVLVGTHIYNGWTDELLTTKFAEMVQYAKNAGLTFVTLNEGYRQFEPYFTYNEMH